MDWTTGLALASLLVSLFVAWRQHRAAGRAHFTTDWETHESLVFTNRGPGAARNLSAILPSQLRTETIEAAYMGAFQSMRIPVFTASGLEPPGPLELTWRDNRLITQRLSLDVPQQPSLRHVTPSARDGIDKAVRQVALEVARKEIEAEQRLAATRRRTGSW